MQLQKSKKVIILLSFVLVISGSLFNVAYGSSTDWLLPNKKITPGAINKDVNQSNIQLTICKVGWTDTIRPSSSYTNSLKKKQLENEYKHFAEIFGTNLGNYEEDHLISLQLGGDPKDPKNLFPQPYAGYNARTKDIIETKLKKMVCAGQIKLSTAQKAIASNWVKAYNKYK